MSVERLLLLMSTRLVLASLVLGSASASAVNDATFNLSITSANGGADSLVSWSYSGTPTASGGVYWGYIWGSNSNIGNAYVSITGPAFSAFNSGLTTVTGLNTGLYLTNTTTNASKQLTEFGTYGTSFAFILGTAGNEANSVPVSPGQVLVLSGPTSGSFLTGVAFSNFNQGQWVFNYANYTNFDPVLTVGPAPVPEPSTYGLALGGLALAVVALRRRGKISK